MTDVIEPMKQSINREDVLLDQINTSKQYPTGKRFPTNHCDNITILGRLANTGGLRFLCVFDNGFLTIANMSNISDGKVENPYFPKPPYNTYLGLGDAKGSEYVDGKRKDTQEYLTWRGMFERCYGPQREERTPSYIGVGVSLRWANFNTFWEDIKVLKGYNEWKTHRGAYHIDKDILSGRKKLYSRNTCHFIPAFDNLSESAKRGNLTGQIYKFIRLHDGYTYVTNDQADFADKTGISRAGVNHIVKGAQESTFGWAVEVFSHLPKVLTLSDKTIVSLENIYETTYIATRLSDGFSEEFTVQRPFAKKYNLSYKSINKCLHGGAKSHKGWTFKIKEEENKEEK